MKCSLSVKVNNNRERELSWFILMICYVGSQVGNSSLKSLNGLRAISNNWYESIKALKHRRLYTCVLHQLCLSWIAFWIISKSTSENITNAIPGYTKVSTANCLERIGEACSDASLEYSLQATVAQGFPWVEVLPLFLTNTKFVVLSLTLHSSLFSLWENR